MPRPAHPCVAPLRHLAAALAAGTTLAGAAAAEPLTEAQRVALDERISTFQTALVGEDYRGVVSIVPPRLQRALAAQSGLSIEELRTALGRQMTSAMLGVIVSDFEDDLDAVEVQSETLEDGTEVLWGIVPYGVTLDTGGEVLRARQQMLAVREDGTWYLVRVADSAALARLASFYPFVAGVEIPAGNVSPVE